MPVQADQTGRGLERAHALERGPGWPARNTTSAEEDPDARSVLLS